MVLVWRIPAHIRSLPKLKFHEGMPHFTKFDGRRSTFLVLDDLMSETNDDAANLFTKGSHHRNVSVMFLTELILQKQAHAYHQSEYTLHGAVQKSTRCRSVFRFGSTDVSQRIQICRRNISRCHGKTVWVSVCGLETSAGRTIQT